MSDDQGGSDLDDGSDSSQGHNQGFRVSNLETVSSSDSPMTENIKTEVPEVNDAVEERRYPSRNRKAPQNYEPSMKGQSYQAAMVQFACMAQVVEKHERKRLSMKRGMKVWGNKGREGVKSELSQIH